VSGRDATRRIGRPPREDMPEGERRARILQAAGALFIQRGYAAVSIGDIAAAVGVSKAALYHHFPSKDELYTTMMCELLTLIAEAMRAIVAAPEPLRTRIRRLAAGIAGAPADTDVDAMMRDVGAHLTPAQQRRIADASAALAEPPLLLMREGIASGELRGDAGTLAHAFTHLLVAFSGRVGMDAGFGGRPEVIEAVVDLFLHGVAADGAGRAGGSPSDPPSPLTPATPSGSTGSNH